ncbi:cytochrome c nitrite reductase pentaheme subunit [Enterobacteriaceae bacterium BIT-l23]|uniref:cytochrome c nitrite reductase pentaheme subunit n=1 Tax=Jejubacter sp. L23 TaxID=3092086 RepID=UPI001584E428|nr:cytochrome c nitrite reductase pentaheme subunit [Enterobacteriaceae bacterium BIT-l23]
MRTMRWLLTVGFGCLWLMLLSLARADTGVELQRSRDQACLDCHKSHQQGMLGQHARATNPNNGLPVTCTDCHGRPGPRHREGAKDVMRYNDPAFSVEQQNSVCFACHQPEALREAFWPHDVHAATLTCSGCHRLHPDKDRVTMLNDKARVRLCVDCHREQQGNPAFNPASVWPDKERP